MTDCGRRVICAAVGAESHAVLPNLKVILEQTREPSPEGPRGFEPIHLCQASGFAGGR
jgi:hypothetical protein